MRSGPRRPAKIRGAYRAAIFDLDGVLVDTAEFHYLAWKEIADELGVPFDRRKNERLRGVPRMESLAIVVESLLSPPPNMDELAARKNARYVEMIGGVRPSDLLPGVEELLGALRGAAIPIGLASSSKNAKTVLEHLGIASRFTAIVDGFGFVHPKPSPEIFLNCARLLGVPPDCCVGVEDAEAGIEGIRAAGMYAVGIARHEPLPGADLTVSGPNEIPLALWGVPDRSPRTDSQSK